jgi:hypothetical protein
MDTVVKDPLREKRLAYSDAVARMLEAEERHDFAKAHEFYLESDRIWNELQQLKAEAVSCSTQSATVL